MEVKLSDEKKHLFKLENANNEIIEHKKTIRNMKLEMSELNGANSALEKNNVQLRQDLHQSKMTNDDNNNKNKVKYDQLDAEYKQYKNTHDSALYRYITEIESLKILNQQKQDELRKSDIKYNTDISMYKRKLDDAIKSYDEKVNASEVALMQEKDSNLLLKKQLSSLAIENDQLKATLENVNMYIDSLMNDDNNSKIITMDTIYTSTSAAAESLSLSSSRVNTTDAIETNEYPIDDTDELVTKFNQSYTGISPITLSVLLLSSSSSSSIGLETAMTTLTHFTQHVLLEEKLLRSFINKMATRESQR